MRNRNADLNAEAATLNSLDTATSHHRRNADLNAEAAILNQMDQEEDARDYECYMDWLAERESERAWAVELERRAEWHSMMHQDAFGGWD